MSDYSENFSFKEESYDTIGDILTHPSFKKALKKYKKVQKKTFPKVSYKNVTEGDLLREIFTDGYSLNNSLFLKCLKEEIFEEKEANDIRFLTALILSLEWIKEDINDSPSSIQSIVSEKILTIIGSYKEMVISEEEGGDKCYAYQGIRSLLGIEFPCITEKGDIVYYLHGGEDGTVCVWNPLEKNIEWIDKQGKVLDEEERGKIENLYKQRAEKAVKKDKKKERKKLKKEAKKRGITLVDGGTKINKREVVKGGIKNGGETVSERVRKIGLTVHEGGKD